MELIKSKAWWVKSLLSPVKSTCKQLVPACAWPLSFRASLSACVNFILAWSRALPACRNTHAILTHTCTLAHWTTSHFHSGPWQMESRNNNQVWLHILFSQTSSKLSPSPSRRVLWASSDRQHQSHFIRPSRPSPPLFPGKCLTSEPEPQTNWSESCSHKWSDLSSRNHLAYVGNQDLWTIGSL